MCGQSSNGTEYFGFPLMITIQSILSIHTAPEVCNRPNHPPDYHNLSPQLGVLFRPGTQTQSKEVIF